MPLQVYKGDSFHLMPIITPAYPSMCATFNITKSSMTVIKRELQRGLEITEQVMVGKQPWSDLFVKHTFFTNDYKYYISVISASKTKEAHNTWSGYIESKVRMLVQKLEQHPHIALAQAFKKGYSRHHICKNDQEIEQVQEGSLDFVAPENPSTENVTNTAADGAQDSTGDSEAAPTNGEGDENAAESHAPVDVYTTTHYIGLELEEGTWLWFFTLWLINFY